MSERHSGEPHVSDAALPAEMTGARWPEEGLAHQSAGGNHEGDIKAPRRPAEVASVSERRFAVLPDGTRIRIPITRYRPLTAREALQSRAATSADVIGMAHALQLAAQQAALAAEEDDYEAVLTSDDFDADEPLYADY